MPCKQGNRESIDDAKVRYAEDKKYRDTSEHKHWLWLVDQVHANEIGFSNLSHPNKLYFSANLVSGEVYNGGFEQYFFNSSGDYYNYAVEASQAIGATESLKLLLSASRTLFGEGLVPSDTSERRVFIGNLTNETIRDALNLLDCAFYKDPDNFSGLMTKFAKTHSLHSDF